jgi:predicted TIM-barrel fold metal-dependent hydrolase
MKMRKRRQIELPERPPIWLGNISNGEYYKIQTPYERKLEKFILQTADENARRVGIPRREFLVSAMGMATSLYCINLASACSNSDSSSSRGGKDSGAGGGGGSGGRPAACEGYAIEPEMMYDEDAACSVLSGNEFIFDIQTHHFEPDGEWTVRNPGYVDLIKIMLGKSGQPNESFGLNAYAKIMFIDSDTTMAVLSCWPGQLCVDGGPETCGIPMSAEGAAASRDIINQLANSQRLLNHVMVLPKDFSGMQYQLDMMERLACTAGVSAWKLYPPAGGPDGVGYFLDDPNYGLPVIEKGLEVGVPVFCAHKGLPIIGFDQEHQMPSEIGRVARMYPEAKFIVYHAGICSGLNDSAFLCTAQEGPYVEGDEIGVNALITSMLKEGIGPNENVYAELGSSWSLVMNNATQAGHYLGKLLKYVGENNVCWGTDSMVGGTPQPLIQAMRAATIPESMQAEFEYPALTDEIKAKIFGLNSAAVYKVDHEARRCAIDQSQLAMFKKAIDEEFGQGSWAVQEPMGPRTPEQFLQHGRENRARGYPG